MIIHITHSFGGGTQKYIDDLTQLFPNEDHVIINQSPFTITNIDKIKFVHIHSTMFGTHIGWNVLELIDKLHTHKIPVYLTVHDYQWLFTQNTAPTTEDLETIQPKSEDLKNIQSLFDKVDKLIFPTPRLYDNHKRFVSRIIEEKTFIAPHCDIPLRYKQSFVPKQDAVINIAFVGAPLVYKGIREFYRLVQVMPEYFTTPIKYHIYGGNDIVTHPNVIEHGAYKDKEIIQKLHNDNIHITLSISTAEETYCYSLSYLINSGLSIVYFNRGALTTRLPKNKRFFPVETCNVLALQQAVIHAIRFVTTNTHADYIEMPTDVVLNDFYKNNYLTTT